MKNKIVNITFSLILSLSIISLLNVNAYSVTEDEAAVEMPIENVESEAKAPIDATAVDSTLGKETAINEDVNTEKSADEITKVEESVADTSAKEAVVTEELTNDFPLDLIESKEEYYIFVAFSGDKEDSNDWGYKYYGNGVPEDIIVTDNTIKSGETKTVELKFNKPVLYTWMTAPVIIAKDVCEAEFTVKCYIDDVEVPANNIGYNWRYEAVGDYKDTEAISLGGGYNEWTYRSLGPALTGFTSIRYEVTANSIMVDKAKINVDSSDKIDNKVDKMGKYNAYLGFQTPSYSFRNSWQSIYGLNYKDANNNTYFNQVTGWFGKNPVRKPGTFYDAAIEGNGVYEVSVKGLSFEENEFEKNKSMNLLYISTDIPFTDEINVSEVKLTIDGKEVEMKEPGFAINPEYTDYLNILIQSPEVSYVSDYSVPMKEINISFKLDGFDYDLVIESDEEEVIEGTESFAPMVRNPSNEPESIVVSIIALFILIILIIFLEKKNLVGNIKIMEEVL